MLNLESFFPPIIHKRICFLGQDIKIVYNDSHFVRSVKERLISDIEKGFVYFSFGKQTEFTEMCYDLLSELQKKFPNIVREKFMCEDDDDSRVYEKINHLRHNTEFEQNKCMIDKSDICYVYYFDYILPSQVCRLKDQDLKKYKNETIYLSYNYAKELGKDIFLIKK